MNPVKTGFGGVFLLAGLVLGCPAAAATFAPFYADVQTDEGSFFAVRPLYSRTALPEAEICDVFWPLYSRKQFKDEQTSRALIFWWTHHFNKSVEEGRYRRWLLPFYFEGRDAEDRNYGALFPVGGTIHEFLGRDQISFVMFPVYAKSRINEVNTTSVLWPVFSRTRGPGIQRDRVFPIYGKSTLEGKYEKRFVLWPFWTSADYFYPGDSGRAWILFPLYGQAMLDRERTRWFIPPFFRFTDGERQQRVFCPWPFFQKLESDRRERLYVWPLWGRDRYQQGLNQRTFLLWPVFWSEQIERTQVSVVRRRAVPFFYMQREFRKEEEGVPEDEREETAVQWRIWPLMSWRQNEEASRFRMLELWPITDSPPVERNWAPFWTLYRRAESGGAVRHDLLWFLWNSRSETESARKEWSLLRGLISYRQDAKGDGRLRLFWMPQKEPEDHGGT